MNDSPTATELLRRLVCTCQEHQIAWIARDGAEAVKLCETDLPELVLMDLIMPYMDGAEATRQIMRRTPCPILIVTATVAGNAAKVFQALSAGAIDAIQTPTMVGSLNTGPALLLKIKSIERQASGFEPAVGDIIPKVSNAANKLILIGASAGGPAALVEVLSTLPEDFSPAVVIVQHIGQLFAPGLVEWLNEYTKLPVRLAREGDSLGSGNVLVAGTEDHLVFKNSHELGYTAEPKENPYRPSVDVFFGSAARYCHGAIAGVLLTGMGRDGARGLKILREAGCHTISQDQSTSAVYGMPKAAAAINAATEILPLQKIGPRLRELFSPEARR
ncbi:MAG TPA: chemotaxis-specific protein-glutamate methyltransferase CheB [Chthoniobacterales bacterium]|nr:chemotaxis-specific protein-glutamate methyltransferase CheB [Chthoniobacterales bacterium]